VDNKQTTILVSDSGLGGLSVFTDIANQLKENSSFEKITMVYFNAWPEQDRGYNHLPDMEAKARVFNNAMNAMAGFNPDSILIACNTLSVVYPFTAFSKNTSIPVTGIVDHGIALIHENLTKNPDSQVIIFGTPTTIEDGSHKKALVKSGIDPERIINQGCVNLAGKIERDPFSMDVSQMIEATTREAALQLKPYRGKVFAALCCTHFGYCKELFSKALARHTKGEICILNPNTRMAQMAWETKDIIQMPDPKIDMKIVSRVFWEESRIMAYEKLLGQVSPQTIEALKKYTWNKDLFQIA
jgi:glutamate racemase